MNKGFTIVELLIVVVVIAILAAVTIVGYNGIQNSAKESSAQSAASQAAKKVAQFHIQNAETYPANQAAFDSIASAGGGTTYQYVANNSANPKTFCLTTTVQDVSYYINNTNTTKPTKGGCPGHGQNGVAAITNVALSPRGMSANALYSNNGATHPLTRSVALSPATPDGITVGAEQRINAGVVGDQLLSIYNLDGLNNTAGFSRSMSAWVRVNATGYELRNNGSFLAVDIPANQWVRIATTNPFTGSVHSGIQVVKKAGQGNVAETDRGWITGVMSVEGSTNYAFRDGNSPSWLWSGGVNGSSSYGPAP